MLKSGLKSVQKWSVHEGPYHPKDCRADKALPSLITDDIEVTAHALHFIMHAL